MHTYYILYIKISRLSDATITNFDHGDDDNNDGDDDNDNNDGDDDDDNDGDNDDV
jgi:hypothetical protein